MNAWEPGQADYLQFLVDSRHVYATLEELVNKYDALAQYRNSGYAVPLYAARGRASLAVCVLHACSVTLTAELNLSTCPRQA